MQLIITCSRCGLSMPLINGDLGTRAPSMKTFYPCVGDVAHVCMGRETRGNEKVKLYVYCLK